MGLIIFMCFLYTAKACPYGMEYSQCTSKCARTCGNLYSVMPAECSQECYPGCRCAPNTFLNSTGECVVASQCPCIYQQEEHQSKSVVKVDCNTW